jgi:thiol:disulfide interchange protein DsbC
MHTGLGASAVAAAAMSLGLTASAPNDAVMASLKQRLPKTQVSAVDCSKVDGLCEVTAGSNLFYVDKHGRYLVIGRVYDMETRQDLTAARLLEMNPDMLVGGAAKVNAAADAGAGRGDDEAAFGSGSRRVAETDAGQQTASRVDLSQLSSKGAIVWGRGATSVTVFSDFHCGYCRALSQTLRTMDVRVIEGPISVLGSRDIADRVLCSKNREAAVHHAYAQEPLDNEGKCDTSGLDENERFARAHGFTGTPVIVRSDGAVLEGYRPKEVLAAWLKGRRS